jgi:succinate-semialdehyde dehydrogenase/glutarate-semialdehyde dehydrogenase
VLTSPLLAALPFPTGPDHPCFSVHNPATGEEIASLPRLGADDATAACDAAATLVHPDGFLPLDRRADLLLGCASRLRTHRDELARIVHAENGKPGAEAAAEVDYAAAFFTHAATVVPKLAPRRVPGDPRGKSWTIHARPAGVVACITPWNFPIAMVAKKLSAAWAAGCPAVWKPAEETPLSAVALRAVFDHAPADALRIACGDAPAIGEALCAHPAVRLVSFTGSTPVGRLIAAQAGAYGKRVALELGGNAPFIVFADADLDAAADAFVANKMRASGQTCVCANRVLAERGVAEAFAARIADRLARLAPGTEYGPLITADAAEKVRRHRDDALARGARIVLDGVIEGAFVTPSVLLDVPASAACMRDETFGPLVPIAAFDTEADAIARANDVDQGLAAYVFTPSEARASRVAGRLQFGHVGINTGMGPTPEAPFGGMKASGFGREGGDEGVFECVEWQTVVG